MKNLGKLAFVFSVLLVFTILVALFMGAVYKENSGNVAVIPINGEITTQSSLFSVVASSDDVVDKIKDANSNPGIEAIIFEIDSPGGTIVATREIANEIKDINKTTICWLRETAASGAYWIASNCDKIVADPYTITGSIGVSGSYLEFSDFFEKYGIDYVRVVSGEKKDMGSPFKEPSEEEIEELNAMVEEIKMSFISEVKTNRNLSDSQVTELEEGGIILGKEAKEIGLVDVLGGEDEAIALCGNLSNVSEIHLKEYEKELSFSELTAGFFGESMAKYFLANNFNIKV